MIKSYEVEIEGTTPLLMHWDNIEWADEMEHWKSRPENKKKSKAGDDRTPAFRWIGSVYNDGKVVSIPAEIISPCLMQAGAMVPVPGAKGSKTFKAQTQSGMKIDAPYYPLIINGGTTIPYDKIAALMDEDSFPEHMQAVKKLGFKLFIKRAAVGSSKHVRVRPRFEEWKVKFQISVWDDQLTDESLRLIFENAGMFKGLGDWRPSSPRKPGSFGMFKLNRMEQIS